MFPRPVPVLLSTPKGTVSVDVDQETCLWHAVMLARIAGDGALLAVGDHGEMWTYGLEGGEA